MNATVQSRPAVVSPAVITDDVGSAVSWGAIFAGAAVAAAMSLILLLLGMGFGLSSVSPWSFEGVSAETFGWTTIAWISFTSLFASGLGGYIAGRLRRRWVAAHGDETFFRDTAHGFVAWAVATLFTAAALTSAVGAIVGTGAKAGASLAGGLAGTAVTAGAAGVAGMASEGGDGAADTVGYYVDRLLRSGSATPAAPAPTDAPADATSISQAAPPVMRAPETAAARDEVTRIIATSLRNGELSAEDTTYLAQTVAARSGLTVQEAEARVRDAQTQLQAALAQAETTAKEAADAARKAAAYASLWLFITLLMGAFAASLMATFGGRQRDA